MNQIQRLAAAAILSTSLFACAAPGKPTETPSQGDTKSGGQVIIISIDGLRTAFYNAPTLSRLIAMGASSEGAEPIYPSVTYPSHTSIVTGVRSAKHGILSNIIFTKENGISNDWYWDVKNLKSPTLWQQAKAQGKTTAILTWPVSVGADVDWLVPELFPGDPTAKESTWDMTRKQMNPELLKELMLNNSGLVLDGFDQRDEWVTNATQHMIREHHPDLMLVHIINVDHVEHESGKESPQTLKALSIADSELNRIVETIDFKKTTLIVLGDHGFYDYDKVININTLFRDQGWLKVQLDGKIAPDWKVMAHLSGGQAAIYSRDPRLDRKVVALLKRHAGAAYQVIERLDLDRMEAFPGAVCAIDPAISAIGADGKPAPGYSVGKDATGRLIASQGRVRGNHGPLPSHPEMRTGFIAVGPGIPAGKKLGLISLLDVAPTAAGILGITMPPTEGHALNLH